MGRRRSTETTPELAAEAGFPVSVRVPHADGELVLSNPHDGRETFTVERGLTTASTRARLDRLVRAGGRAVLIAPSESGHNAADSGDEDS